jgi:hypothetical protein
MLTKQNVAENVWVIYSDTQEEIGRAFIRFQEFYENKDLKGTKDITIRQIEDWWAREAKNLETPEPYYTFWAGFNLPGHVILALLSTSEFRSGFSLWRFIASPKDYPRWHPEEDRFLDLLQDLTVHQILTGYFIGVSKDSTEVFDHELSHALFATNSFYKSEQVYNLSRLPKDVYESFRLELLSNGYHRDVIHDEMQAYFSTYTNDLPEEYKQHIGPFIKTFKKFTEPQLVEEELIREYTGPIYYEPCVFRDCKCEEYRPAIWREDNGNI